MVNSVLKCELKLYKQDDNHDQRNSLKASATNTLNTLADQRKSLDISMDKRQTQQLDTTITLLESHINNMEEQIDWETLWNQFKLWNQFNNNRLSSPQADLSHQSSGSRKNATEVRQIGV